jgi:uncharacterized membrane protein YedE/YeeE
MDGTGDHLIRVLWGGFFIGLAFGALAQRSEFCLSGGLRECWAEGRPRRAAAFVLAIAVAILSTALVVSRTGIDLGRSIYLQPTFSWLLVPAGGLLFGYGMMLARACGSRSLVLLGDGNLRSLVVLPCLGIAAAVTLTGPLASSRLRLGEMTAVTPPGSLPSLPGLLDHWGCPLLLAHWGSVGVMSVVLLHFALFRWQLWKTPGKLLGAAAIGCLPAAAWFVTGRIGADDFEPARLESLTFVAPVRDSIEYLMLSSGISLGFGVAVVAGVILGSLVLSLATRSFELRGFTRPAQMVKAALGGVLMGMGGALALGCSIGQGLTGIATLAIPSILATAGIWVGALAAVRGPLRCPID